MAHDRRLCESYLAAMEVLAKPWNGVLMGALEEGPLRFNQLAERVPAIGDRMLAARLKELEARGVVERSVDPGPPVRVIYRLSPVGRGFRGAAEAVTEWGRSLVRSRGASRARGR